MGDLRERARRVLTENWRSPGFCVPHRGVYPERFLWDSCFHVVIWAALGQRDRATDELAAVFMSQRPDGFVPHMVHPDDPAASLDFWGREGGSSITQPPMYGHAVAELARRGWPVDRDLLDRAERGFRWILEHRRQPDGTVGVLHPWESGMDDSPRWDWAVHGQWSERAWWLRKGELVRSLETDGGGAAMDNPQFRVGSAGFTALVAFNLAEFGSATGRAGLVAQAGELAGALTDLFDPGAGHWRDGAGSGTTGGRRTLDGLLPLLVVDPPAPVDDLLAPLVDRSAMGGSHGPAFVDRREPCFDPTRYWRGSVWAHMTYLAWLAARRLGATDVTAELAAGLRRGAAMSGMAEHWHPDSGEGFGAVPLSWTGLAALVEG